MGFCRLLQSVIEILNVEHTGGNTVFTSLVDKYLITRGGSRSRAFPSRNIENFCDTC